MTFARDPALDSDCLRLGCIDPEGAKADSEEPLLHPANTPAAASAAEAKRAIVKILIGNALSH